MRTARRFRPGFLVGQRSVGTASGHLASFEGRLALAGDAAKSKSDTLFTAFLWQLFQSMYTLTGEHPCGPARCAPHHTFRRCEHLSPTAHKLVGKRSRSAAAIGVSSLRWVTYVALQHEHAAVLL